MTFFFFLPWLMILIPVMINEPVDWYKDHSYLATDTAIDIGVIMFLGMENRWDGMVIRCCFVHFFVKCSKEVFFGWNKIHTHSLDSQNKFLRFKLYGSKCHVVEGLHKDAVFSFWHSFENQIVDPTGVPPGMDQIWTFSMQICFKIGLDSLVKPGGF